MILKVITPPTHVCTPVQASSADTAAIVDSSQVLGVRQGGCVRQQTENQVDMLLGCMSCCLCSALASLTWLLQCLDMEEHAPVLASAVGTQHSMQLS